jgi:hypothetical protein
MEMGALRKENRSSRKSWLPVHKKALCDTQAWLPIRTGAKFKMKTSSPIQEYAPISKRHGKWIFTRGLITTPAPIFAPKNRSNALFKADGQGRALKKNTILTRYHTPSNQLGRPRSRFRAASNKSKRIRVMVIGGS